MRSRSAFFARHGLALTAVLGFVSIATTMAVTACLPDPEKDYNDFIARSAGAQGGTSSSSGGNSEAGVPEAALIDTRPPDVAVDQLYIAICTTALAANDPNQALRFYAESKFLPDSSGATNGSITLTFTPMKGWLTAPPPGNFIEPKDIKVTKADTRGAAFELSTATIAKNGTFTSSAALVTLPEEANSISGRLAEIAGITLTGVYGNGDRFCSSLGGQLKKPYEYTFKPEQNTCLFIKAKDGDALPDIPKEEYVCAAP